MNICQKSSQRNRTEFAGKVLALAVLLVEMGISAQAQIPTPKPLYGFQQEPTDAIEPTGPRAQGRDGNVYGVGVNRGANNKGGVFKITPAGKDRRT